MSELLRAVVASAKEFDLDVRAVLAFISVETGGQGFDAKTGKILIQFEPVWFKRNAPYAPTGFWSVNKVDVQVKEWQAFNDAFVKDADAAMKSTSIGLGQIMGFHFGRLGYKSVGQMWDDAKKGEDRQVWQMCKFISTDLKLKYAIKAKAWTTVASIYNGAKFKELAVKWGREPYDISLRKAYESIDLTKLGL